MGLVTVAVRGPVTTEFALLVRQIVNFSLDPSDSRPDSSKFRLGLVRISAEGMGDGEFLYAEGMQARGTTLQCCLDTRGGMIECAT